MPEIIKSLSDGGCEIRGDELCKEKFPNIKIATEEDWKTEYLDAIISIKIVNGIDDALNHISKYPHKNSTQTNFKRIKSMKIYYYLT